MGKRRTIQLPEAAHKLILDQSISFRMSADDRAAFEAAAKRADLPMQLWMRRALRRAAGGE